MYDQSNCFQTYTDSYTQILTTLTHAFVSHASLMYFSTCTTGGACVENLYGLQDYNTHLLLNK